MIPLEQEPAFALHRKPYKENNYLIDIFSLTLDFFVPAHVQQKKNAQKNKQLRSFSLTPNFRTTQGRTRQSMAGRSSIRLYSPPRATTTRTLPERDLVRAIAPWWPGTHRVSPISACLAKSGRASIAPIWIHPAHTLRITARSSTLRRILSTWF